MWFQSVVTTNLAIQACLTLEGAQRLRHLVEEGLGLSFKANVRVFTP